MSSSLLKLYGVPLSQPTRSVVWALLLKQLPFEFVLTVPGLDKPNIGARHESFRSKTRTRSITVPLLEVGDGACITESAAMLMYICETTRPTTTTTTSRSNNNDLDLYGSPGTLYKATIDSYLHWHHTNTRVLGFIASSYMMPGRQSPVENNQVEIHKILKRLEKGWLSSKNGEQYIAGGPTPSIADLLCYDEIVQVTWTGLVNIDGSGSGGSGDHESSPSSYPNLVAWTQRMQQLPYHDPVHAALRTLGNLKQDSDIPHGKRLSRATKAGMEAIQQAQQHDFVQPAHHSKL
mmetsp:Transcript_10914/g.14447  ORF Transcript_10914/g.14447 Transcript_10914/m.14447 type:complete len:292 (-) Transcript_10914:417-1292(-)